MCVRWFCWIHEINVEPCVGLKSRGKSKMVKYLFTDNYDKKNPKMPSARNRESESDRLSHLIHINSEEKCKTLRAIAVHTIALKWIDAVMAAQKNKFKLKVKLSRRRHRVCNIMLNKVARLCDSVCLTTNRNRKIQRNCLNRNWKLVAWKWKLN